MTTEEDDELVLAQDKRQIENRRREGVRSEIIYSSLLSIINANQTPSIHFCIPYTPIPLTIPLRTIPDLINRLTELRSRLHSNSIQHKTSISNATSPNKNGM
jgi:hypothetical protein